MTATVAESVSEEPVKTRVTVEERRATIIGFVLIASGGHRPLDLRIGC